MLRYAIAYALRRSRKVRYAVADHIVAHLKERGDPWRLNEEAKTAKAPTT